ncbi:MAG TPA: TIGR02147 family protein [Fibrobacteria bacterium]|nr:TIGR02147 family protein [Fibrobacteria bacterium]
MDHLPLRIFEYTDYRAFLKDALQAFKEKDAKFSQRWVVQRLGVKSSGWLADMLAGRRNLTRTQTALFSSLLSLSAREELYFQTLVAYDLAKTLPEKNRCYEKLLTFHEIPKDLVDPDRFEYFSHWWIPAIREYLLVEPYRGDAEKLARKMRPPIQPAQAKAAVDLLERLGMVKRYASGERRPAVEHVKKQSQFSASVHYYRYLKAQMELGLGAMESIPKEERDISAVTLTLSEEGFATLREELKELRRKMVQLSETENRKFWHGVEGDSRRVYQAVLQLFPVSTTRNAKEAKP